MVRFQRNTKFVFKFIFVISCPKLICTINEFGGSYKENFQLLQPFFGYLQYVRRVTVWGEGDSIKRIHARC